MDPNPPQDKRPPSHIMHILVPSSLRQGSEVDVEECQQYWDSEEVKDFFKSHGYTLYERLSQRVGSLTPFSKPAQVFESLEKTDFPYAGYDSTHLETQTTPLLARDWTGKVIFAQDALGRHVAIKVVQEGSNEYHVLDFLRKQPDSVIRANCVIPVLDLLPTNGFWFAVMPRWGELMLCPPGEKLYEILDLMHSMLKGLTFLHKHNICHGDVRSANVLVNHFCDINYQGSNNVRRCLRLGRNLMYVLCDFDHSFVFHAEVNKDECRIEYTASWKILHNIHDTVQGEFDYDPFAFDVGNMGAMFCYHFQAGRDQRSSCHYFYTSVQHLTAAAPFLAPLLDTMTSRDLQRRFSSAEALTFLEKAMSEMSPTELEKRIWSANPHQSTAYDEYDRWKDVPQDLQNKWAAYREPSLSRPVIMLRKICKYTICYRIIAFLRWSVHEVVASVRGVYGIMTSATGLLNDPSKSLLLDRV